MADRYSWIVHTDAHRRYIHQMVDKTPVGWTISASEPVRTNAQNDRMWALLTDVARSKPQARIHTPEVWKCIFMDAAGHKVKWVPSLDLESVVNVGYRSSRLTKPMMSDLMESISAYGAENGVVWSEPRREAA